MSKLIVIACMVVFAVMLILAIIYEQQGHYDHAIYHLLFAWLSLWVADKEMR